MTGLGAGDAGPTGDLQVQLDEPESDSLPSQVGAHPPPPLSFFVDNQSNLKHVLKKHSWVIKLEFAPED